MGDPKSRGISKMNNRRLVNVVNFIVTCGVLFVSVGVVNCTFTQRINKISQNLDKTLLEMLEMEQTNYTEWSSNISYKSNTHFNPRGMGGVYNLTNEFMDVILPELYVEGMNFCFLLYIIVYVNC